MIAEDIEDFFAPFLQVNLRRMFGGHGVYADGRMIALEADGELFLKADAISRPFFEGHGSTPFTYEKKAGQQAVMSYFRVPDAAFEDDRLRRECIEAALDGARRAAAKPKKAGAKKPRGRSGP